MVLSPRLTVVLPPGLLTPTAVAADDAEALRAATAIKDMEVGDKSKFALAVGVCICV